MGEKAVKEEEEEGKVRRRGGNKEQSENVEEGMHSSICCLYIGVFGCIEVHCIKKDAFKER